ncbi:methylated-DNA--[protein]-cysteine S-methyltransferase [Halorussus halophilus]|uniref:methylated-DNA--[protein]-cysteine S-methyltransferase n=1 Tax=Halorussus halophilus TaxID=2650975 RepID=UPI0013018A3D|nr:methylated-DNA--[protein]-cysteine S-methyltransferase [Halorussus halophilus]
MELSVFDQGLSIADSHVAESPEEVRGQVREYESGERDTFDLTITPLEGFSGDVMEAMAAIPYGETRTYGELADELDTAAVAVGQACSRNPVPLVVPCHRVVGANGALCGYSADGGLELKERLLQFEGALD